MDFPRWSAVVGVVIWRRCRTAFDVGALVGADKAQMESKGDRHTSQAIRQISSGGDNSVLSTAAIAVLPYACSVGEREEC